MGVEIKASGIVLPSPVEIATSAEVIWSANTGRSTTGLMLGDVIAEKETFTIRWGVLTRAEYKMIETNLKSGFRMFSVRIDGEEDMIESYRGTLVGNLLGTFGGVTYYKDASVSIIQR